jgi:hypothetical protein
MADLDEEVNQLCNSEHYHCACGAYDLRGMGLCEFIGGQIVQTGVLCSTCQETILARWLKAGADSFRVKPEEEDES